MATMPLRRFLQSLCDNSCWNYAVFWKLQQQSQMVLMWEDGYFGTLKVEDNIFGDNSFTSLEETSSCNGALGGNAVELAVAYMPTFQYALGDGVIGDVAYTGNCRWVFADSKSSSEYNTALVAEHADEWLFQFAAGVKTILVVPVIPHGVIQLGSLEDLPEDAQMANYIKDEFIAHQDFMSYSNSFATNQPFSSEPPLPLMKMDDFPSFIATVDNNNINWSNHKSLTNSLITPTFDNRYSSHLAGAHSGPTELPEPQHHLTDSNAIETDVGPFFNFPIECELHKALGPAFQHADSSFSQFNPSLFSNNSVVPATFNMVNNHNDSYSSRSGITYEGVVDELAKDEQKEQKVSLHQNNGSKPSKKRGKHQKPRPRDRQLIQDRLKDLRKLVPDSAKCSIDGLLEKTIKHMMFLESVGDRAMKLRQCVQPQEIGTGQKNNKISEEKGSKNGASWAVELGSDLKVCPIIVEDLQYPGHMIIEMVCEESIRFLEIAEVIHGLELTILNGLMENCSGTTFARYIVEAPKGFHRLDIFWPLMKLLQQQQQHSPISSKI